MKRYAYVEQNNNNDFISEFNAADNAAAAAAGLSEYNRNTAADKSRIIAAYVVCIDGYSSYDEWADENAAAFSPVWEF